MEEKYELILSSLESKMQKIIASKENLLAENIALTSEVEKYKANEIFLNNKIKELEQKIDDLQMTGAFETSNSDIKDARQNIGKLVKELDKCIALLND
ncbi:MAG: hypothetical protein WCS34_04925 [Bacteroidales bacterium]